MHKLGIVAVGMGLSALLTGCVTQEVDFLASSAPVPQQGYKVIGKPVSGTCSQSYILGFGGNAFSSQQFSAFEDALEKTEGADALVNMAIDRHVWSPIFLPFIWEIEAIRVTGTPVKYK